MSTERITNNADRTLLATLAAAFVSGSLASAAADADAKLLPPYGELPPTFWEQHRAPLIASAALLLIAVAIGFWLWFRPKPVVEVPPVVEARNDLEPLRSTAEDTVVLGTVSRVVRRYFVRAYALPANEPTTAELVRVLCARTDVPAGVAARTGELLRQCDERKFARESTAEPLNAVARALELVALAETRARPTRPPPIPGALRPEGKWQMADGKQREEDAL